MRGYPQFCFWKPRALANYKLRFLCIVSKPRKNIPVLESITHGKPSVSRCAERMRKKNRGTVLKIVIF